MIASTFGLVATYSHGRLLMRQSYLRALNGVSVFRVSAKAKN